MLNDRELEKRLKRYIREEVRSPEVQKAKELFFGKIFHGKSFFLFKPQVFMPIIAAAFVVVVFAWFVWIKPQPVVQPDLGFKAAESPVMESDKARVKVKRVSSKTGPTMVYQKVSEGVPVTVVWVFNGGSV